MGNLAIAVILPGNAGSLFSEVARFVQNRAKKKSYSGHVIKRAFGLAVAGLSGNSRWITALSHLCWAHFGSILPVIMKKPNIATTRLDLAETTLRIQYWYSVLSALHFWRLFMGSSSEKISHNIGLL